PYPVSTSEWIAQATSGINSILKVSETVSREAQRLAEEQSSASKYSLFLTGLLLFVLLSVLFISVWIAKLITQPINYLAASALKVSEGDLNQSINYNSKDEIGQLSSAFNKMIENLRTAYNDLHTEKESVEKKVEKAVRDSEEQREYLERSAETILSEMDKFAAGDLTVYLEKEKDDVIGSLFVGFNKVVSNIRMMIEKVIEAIAATASASSQISSSSEEMAAGAQEQSSQTTEIASAVEQMTKTIIETSTNVNRASEAAKESRNIALDGGSVVNDTIIGMNSIAEVVIQAACIVKELGTSSDKIGEIVQVIDDIADQTNLLALNAAIEAARAGEQGRGFAVVADEVRKLAERTTKATKEIAVMIKQIQKDTNGAVDSMNKGTEEVEKGKALADKAGKSLKEIIVGVEQVLDMSTQVAAASEEQSSAAEQISKNIEAISCVTQESAAGVQQIARAAEDLNRLTVNLQELTSRFKIDGTSSNGNERTRVTKRDLIVRSNGIIVHK
ncbi:MAG: HAMP domain-containing methyl-accepting chemotaxis protein, partial [Ignavibacteriaceae bacterium]|nr:HAMP domain-containing methyl-accepting chemotaxis protein [Ignavibacteriaceae bacterium]